MGIVNKIRGVIGDAEEQTAETYACDTCGAEFDSRRTTCDKCGSTSISLAG